MSKKKPTQTTKKADKPKDYKIEMFFNGAFFNAETDNVEEAIRALKPETLYTEIFITITKGEYVLDRRLTLTQGKRLFLNDEFMEVFISNILF